ncbi:alkaline phosphatase family protein [Mucilaginibacter sp.]|uniref:alkaline phosphatase family protein n=1 Tax=Mucilaginibacter sp. TaxID=1882438 RepID=UPI00261F8182|nr:alkaline phosphatase family protein [Mucilaginibacter sp.]MDB4920317.1 Phospholipase [Mucilaginibacter sp.]
MAHQCKISISNINNQYALTLQSITSEGSFSNVVPAGTSIQNGAQIPAGETLSFVLTGGIIESAAATMVWLTGAAENNTQAEITMTFANNSILLLGNKVDLSVAPASVNSSSALPAYGVSYFYASEGNSNPMGRDHINKAGAHSPVYVNYAVVANTFVTEAPPTPFLPGITNVVMLMMENRSLDNLLGQIYASSNPAHVYPARSAPEYDGLPLTFSNTYDDTTLVVNPVPAGEWEVPNPDPGEPWYDVNQQVFNIPPTECNPYSTPPAGAIPNMGGFLANYAAQPHNGDPAQIMQFYTPAHLPVLSTLATSYSVSDAWFCSVPSQTFSNRAFSIAGTSNGFVDNYKKYGTDPLDVIQPSMRSIFHVLSNCGNDDWGIYWHRHALEPIPITAEIFPQVRDLMIEQPGNFQQLKTFFDTIDNQGTLPAFCYLEPVFYPEVVRGETLVAASDYHPPYNVCPAEQLLAEVYNKLSTYKNWDTTLFIVTFDEHGGTLDHVPPGPTIAPDEMTDWSGFTFNQLGVRIPTLLISPRVAAGTVFRSPDPGIPFDHTSFVRTILGWQGIDVSGGVMGARAVQAPDFSGVLANSPVNKAPVTLEPISCTNTDADMPLNDLQKCLLAMLGRHISGAEPGSDKHKLAVNKLVSLNTVNELTAYVKKAKRKVKCRFFCPWFS